MDEKFWEIQIFKGISENSKTKILKMDKKEVYYKSGETLFNEGDEINYFGVILDGVLKCTEYTISGKELNSSYFFNGDAFPFYLIYGGASKYNFNIVAFKKSKVVLLPVVELKEIIDSDIVFLHNILTFVAEYNCYSKILLRCVQYRRVIERLSYWLLNINEADNIIQIPNSQEVLANILHVNRSSLNQELVFLERLGVIECNRRNIKILDRKYLEDLL